jgi:hypothetical protein
MFAGAATARLRGVSYLGNRLDYAWTSTEVTITLQTPTPAARLGGEPAARAVKAYAGACEASADVEACEAAVAAAAATDAGLRLVPQGDLAFRSQVGQVVVPVAGVLTRLAATPLVVVDAGGEAHPLTPGVPLVLPVQLLAVQAAASLSAA